MLVYKINFSNNYFDRLQEEYQINNDEKNHEYYMAFRGKPWTKVPDSKSFKFIKGLKYTDFPSKSSDFFMSEKALKVMEESYSGIFQKKRVIVGNSRANYFQINFIDNVPLNLKESKVKRFKNGRILNIRPITFQNEYLENKVIFRGFAEDYLTMNYYATDLFKDLYESSGLEGLGFIPVLDTLGDKLPKERVPINGYTLSQHWLLDIIPSLKDKYSNHKFLIELMEAYEFLCHCDGDGAIQPFEDCTPSKLNTIIKGMNQVGLEGGIQELEEGAGIIFSFEKEKLLLLRDLEFYDDELSDYGEDTLKSDPKYKILTKEELDLYARGFTLVDSFTDKRDPDYDTKFALYLESIIDKIKSTGILDERTKWTEDKEYFLS